MAEELKVDGDFNISDENHRTYGERQVEINALNEQEKEVRKRQKNSPFKSFVQMNKETYHLEDKLMKQNPLAYRIWRFLVNNMDSYNAVMVSYSVLTEIFDSGRTTIYRAIKLLEDDGYIGIYKSGTSNVYALNHEMVWNSWGKNLKHSKFKANIIISETEQSEKIQKNIKLKTEKHKEIKISGGKEERISDVSDFEDFDDYDDMDIRDVPDYDCDDDCEGM